MYRSRQVLAVVALVLSAGAVRAQAVPLESSVAIVAAAQEVVENFRRTLVLHDLAKPGRPRFFTQAGQYLFWRNRELAAQMVDTLAPRREAANGTALAALLDAFDARKDWRDPDRLALGGVINEALARLSAGHPAEARLRAAATELTRVRALYNRELTAALAERLPTAPLRPDWNVYVKFLHQQYPVGGILDKLQTELVPEPSAVPLRPESQRAIAHALRDEWTDGELPPKVILLTFDDGPHPRHTDQILTILGRYGIKSVFFQVGQNLRGLHEGRTGAERGPEIELRILQAGHAIANHTYSHPFLPKLDEVRVSDEIDRTEQLLAAAAPGDVRRAPLFRPPYGARNDLVLVELADRGLRSVLWNIDSRDWADPIPHSIAHRVAEEAERYGQGIVLMHDIHARTVTALPLIIDELIKRGFRFAHWDGTRLVADIVR